jgi:hypothetical protein
MDLIFQDLLAESIEHPAAGILVFLSFLRMETNPTCLDFIHVFLVPYLRILIPRPDLILEGDAVPVVVSMICFVPDDEVEVVHQFIAGQFRTQSHHMVFTADLRFIVELFPRLSPKLRTYYAQDCAKFVAISITSPEKEIID